MAKRKTIRRKKTGFPFGAVLLWLVLIVQTIWLVGFMWSTRSLLPRAFSEWTRDADAAVWDASRQDNLEYYEDMAEEMRLRKMLIEAEERAE